MVHGLRHTFATELANVSIYTLMKLLGHESMVTSQRYVDGAGTEAPPSSTRFTTSSRPGSGTHERSDEARQCLPRLIRRYFNYSVAQHISRHTSAAMRW
jgi:hypothetical protein